jgi:hypothetical protein
MTFAKRLGVGRVVVKSAAGLLFGCILTTIFFARCKKTWLGWRLGNETLHVGLAAAVWRGAGGTSCVMLRRLDRRTCGEAGNKLAS